MFFQVIGSAKPLIAMLAAEGFGCCMNTTMSVQITFIAKLSGTNRALIGLFTRVDVDVIVQLVRGQKQLFAK